MNFNKFKCQHCKGFHAPHESADRPVILESQIIKRGNAPFYMCPSCEALFAVKPIAGKQPVSYAIISSASTVEHDWIVDGEDGSRQRARGKMTEEEAAAKHSNAVKVPLRVIR